MYFIVEKRLKIINIYYYLPFSLLEASSDNEELCS